LPTKKPEPALKPVEKDATKPAQIVVEKEEEVKKEEPKPEPMKEDIKPEQKKVDPK